MTPPIATGRQLSLTFLGDPNSIHTRRWLGFFAERGHHVHLILASDRPFEAELDPRITVHPFPSQPRRFIRGTGVLAARRRLRAILAATNTDVLHAHYLTGYGWLARLSGFQPYVVTVWGSDVFLTPRRSLSARVWARVSLRGANIVTADSAELARGAVSLGARPDRTRIIQFGVDTDRFTPGDPSPGLRERLGVEGRRVVFAPRSIAPLYRTTTAIDALDKLPGDVVLVLTSANAEPDYLRSVKDLVVERGLSDRVRIVPPITHDDMVDFYRLGDVVLSIPETDGTPVSILEAMACGRPIVATNLPSVREWLSGTDGSSLVAIGDPHATAAALVRQMTRGRGFLDDDMRRARAVVVARGDHVQNLLRMEADYRNLADSTP